MNIFVREIKAHRKSLIIWCISVFLMTASGMGKYAVYSTNGQSLNILVAHMPKSLQAVLGFSSFDLSKALGYYGVIFLYLLLMTTIHASILGANIISKEERDKTSEFLFVKPVSRKQIITSKLLAAFVNISIINIITLVSSIVMVGHYSQGEAVTGKIAILMGGMYILQWMFMLIGTGIAAISKKPKTAVAVATGILLATFVLNIAIDLNENLGILKYLTPFKYFDAKSLMFGEGFDPLFVILSVVIIATLFCVTYIFYNKRDLNV
ncbi:MAG: ABC transporter permease subunit [Desulfitobacteriaceae bacterium]